MAEPQYWFCDKCKKKTKHEIDNSVRKSIRIAGGLVSLPSLRNGDQYFLRARNCLECRSILSTVELPAEDMQIMMSELRRGSKRELESLRVRMDMLQQGVTNFKKGMRKLLAKL